MSYRYNFVKKEQLKVKLETVSYLHNGTGSLKGQGGVRLLLMVLMHVSRGWTVAVPRYCMFTAHITNVHNLLVTFCHY
jgi:hypothetical protein